MTATNLIFKAIGEPTRREILRLLSTGERTAGNLAACFNMTQPTLSHHFAVLKEAELITSRREAQTIWYALNTTMMGDVVDWAFDLASAADAKKEIQQNRRILLIDDMPSIHEDFRKILIDANGADTGLNALEVQLFNDEPVANVPQFEFEGAFQGQEGLAKVKESLVNQKPFAVAFVDVRMPPGWDGIETIERLWEVDPRLQIVICTAYSDFSWNAIIERLDTRDRLLVLKKPFDAIEVCMLATTLTAKWHVDQKKYTP